MGPPWWKYSMRVGPSESIAQPSFQSYSLLPGPLWYELLLPHAPTTVVSHPAMTFLLGWVTILCNSKPNKHSQSASSCFYQEVWSPQCKSDQYTQPPLLWQKKKNLLVMPLNLRVLHLYVRGSRELVTVCVEHTLFHIPSLAFGYIVMR